MKSVEARFTQKPPPAPPTATPAIIGREVGEKELVGLDEAVRHMGFLEEQLKSGQPLSPPDSRDGDKGKEIEKRQSQRSQQSQQSSPSQQGQPSQPSQPLQAQQRYDKQVAPLTIVKKNTSPVGSIADEEKGPAAAAAAAAITATPLSSSSSSSSSGSCCAAAAASAQPAPPPGGRMCTKSHSPLRNQLDTSSQPSSSPPLPLPLQQQQQQQQPAMTMASAADKGKAKEREGSVYTPSLVYPPPNDHFGRHRPSSGSTSPSAPKPVAKLFVICCRCKYWHDLPSTMYRGMVENGGATRCPYCLHGMETSCCQG